MTKFKLVKLFHPDWLVLYQFVGFLMFYILSNYPYRSIVAYFSFMIFFSYWLIKLLFSKDLMKPKEEISNKKV